jgi:predicted phage replisome organizer
MFDDEKIEFIDGLPEGDAIFKIWVRLLTMAGKCNSNGYIFLTEEIPYTPDMLAYKFRKNLNVVTLALKTFEKLNMIHTDDKGIYVVNWSKYQNTDMLEKIAEQNKLRQQKYREKQKLLQSPKEESTKEELSIDILDKDIDIRAKALRNNVTNNVIILTSDEAEFINTLDTIENYPVDRIKDKEYYHILEERYPTLDLIEAVKTWAIYKKDKPLKPNGNPRSQMNTSFSKYVEWGRCLKGGVTGGTNRGTSKGKSTGNNDPDYSNSGGYEDIIIR